MLVLEIWSKIPKYIDFYCLVSIEEGLNFAVTGLLRLGAGRGGGG